MATRMHAGNGGSTWRVSRRVAADPGSDQARDNRVLVVDMAVGASGRCGTDVDRRGAFQ